MEKQEGENVEAHQKGKKYETMTKVFTYKGELLYAN